MLSGKATLLALTHLLLFVPLVFLVWAAGLVGDIENIGFAATNLSPLLESLSPEHRFLLLGALLGLCTCTAMTTIRILAEKLILGGSGQPPVTFENEELTWPAIAILALSSGLAEELVCRGTILPMVGFWPSCVIFGLIHIASLKSAPYYFLWTFAVGMILGLSFLLCENLWVPIMAHAVHNGLALSWQRLSTPPVVPENRSGRT